jgi:glutamate synthase (NADPH/NADH) large chain
MTGGVVWVYDPDAQRDEPGAVEERLHKDVKSEVPSSEDLDGVRALVEEHFRMTQSPRARAILDQWEEARWRFVKVVPAAAAAPAAPVVERDLTLVPLSKPA